MATYYMTLAAIMSNCSSRFPEGVHWSGLGLRQCDIAIIWWDLWFMKRSISAVVSPRQQPSWLLLIVFIMTITFVTMNIIVHLRRRELCPINDTGNFASVSLRWEVSLSNQCRLCSPAASPAISVTPEMSDVLIGVSMLYTSLLQSSVWQQYRVGDNNIYLFIYLLLKSYLKYMIDREDRQMKIKTQTYHKKN